ncbi:unnamed protein product [Meloidogyne enterolobii]|uniref:Uncharacterized protein n=1 Tax=Meloidogyne enterolobii TaxID=390850 RepID=A0ACB0Z027_MELEN
MYFDCISGQSVLNQGHCHPRLVKVMQDQCQQLTLTSRALYTTALGEYAEYLTKLFGYQKMMPMNSGKNKYIFKPSLEANLVRGESKRGLRTSLL